MNEFQDDDVEEIVTGTAATADHLSVQCDYYIQSSPMFYVNRNRADHGLHGKLVLPYYMRTKKHIHKFDFVIVSLILLLIFHANLPPTF